MSRQDELNEIDSEIARKFSEIDELMTARDELVGSS